MHIVNQLVFDGFSMDDLWYNIKRNKLLPKRKGSHNHISLADLAIHFKQRRYKQHILYSLSVSRSVLSARRIFAWKLSVWHDRNRNVFEWKFSEFVLYHSPIRLKNLSPNDDGQPSLCIRGGIFSKIFQLPNITHSRLYYTYNSTLIPYQWYQQHHLNDVVYRYTNVH